MNGIIVINKPFGLSSSEVCLKVKKILGLRKAGHLGTLDPLATGVLPLCINEGTKLVQFLLKSEKEYIGILQLGIETDTQDSQGKILRKTDNIPKDKDRIVEAFQQFKGEIFQTPPMFSAIKRNGVPLYKIARKGGWVPRKQRKVVIYDIVVLKIDIPHVIFRVVCSHGTYIRTLCHDVGQRLFCGAHMTKLTRVRNGPFHIRESVNMEDFEACSRGDLIEKHLILPKDALNGLQEVVVSDTMEQKIRNGLQITVNDIANLDLTKVKIGQQIKVISCQGSLIGVVESLVNEDMSISCNSSMKAWKTLRVFVN